MLNVLLLAILAAAVFAPLLILSRCQSRSKWLHRYLLAALPAAYTFVGWQLAVSAYSFFGCDGGIVGRSSSFFLSVPPFWLQGGQVNVGIWYSS